MQLSIDASLPGLNSSTTPGSLVAELLAMLPGAATDKLPLQGADPLKKNQSFANSLAAMLCPFALPTPQGMPEIPPAGTDQPALPTQPCLDHASQVLFFAAAPDRLIRLTGAACVPEDPGSALTSDPAITPETPVDLSLPEVVQSGLDGKYVESTSIADVIEAIPVPNGARPQSPPFEQVVDLAAAPLSSENFHGQAGPVALESEQPKPVHYLGERRPGVVTDQAKPSLQNAAFPRADSAIPSRNTADDSPVNLHQAAAISLFTVQESQPLDKASSVFEEDLPQPLPQARKARSESPERSEGQEAAAVSFSPKTVAAMQHRPVISDQLKDAITARLEELGQTGRTEIRLRLDPPHLGPVRIHLTSSAEQVSGRFVVQNEAAKDALEAQMNALRDRLHDAGLPLGRFDVAREGMSHPGQGRPDPRWSVLDDDYGAMTPLSALQKSASVSSRITGLIDLLA